MSRKVFVSYSHRLDQEAAEEFRKLFSDERDVFIDKSIRHDIGELQKETIKTRLRELIAALLQALDLHSSSLRHLEASLQSAPECAVFVSSSLRFSLP